MLRSGQYIGGGVVNAFETSFAAACAVPHAIGCNSGTDALTLALRALEIGPGDEVITSSFSFFATAEAISAVGATPVFVDVDPASYLLDLDRIEAAVTPATRALLPVHLFGRPVDMERINAIALRHGLRVIEDCAQATGASWAGRPVGSWGMPVASAFSPPKTLAPPVMAGPWSAATAAWPNASGSWRCMACRAVISIPTWVTTAALMPCRRQCSTSSCPTCPCGWNGAAASPSATGKPSATSHPPACRMRAPTAIAGTNS